MFETITLWFSEYSKAVVSNPVLALFAVYITGTLTYIIRNVPLKMWQTFKGSVTTTMTLNNAGSWQNEIHYNKFLMWYMTTRWSKWSRHISTGASYNTEGQARVVGPGYGFHFFFIGCRLFWFTKAQLPSTGSTTEKEAITIVTLGRSQTPLLELVDTFAPLPKDSTHIKVHSWGTSEWTLVAHIPERDLDTVCINAEIKAALVADIQRFVDEPEWFLAKGLPYKLSCLFHGCPGSGKTSLIKALASRFSRSIFIADLSSMSNSTFQAAVQRLPRNSLLLLEDVEAATSAVNARKPAPAKGPAASKTSLTLPTSDSTSLAEALGFGLTLSGLLNTLDGIVPMHDVIVCMTTNHLEKLDPALIRKSRMDYMYEIGAMQNAELWAYIDLMYPNNKLPRDYVFGPAVGCDVQALFMEHPHSAEQFALALHMHSRPHEQERAA